MSKLFDVTLSALLSLARAPAVDLPREQPRIERMARAITAAVEHRRDLDAWMPGSVIPLPFKGDAADEGAALALVAIAFHESALREDVQTCRKVGSFEPSITSFQLNGVFSRGSYSSRELCSSVHLAAERALYVFAHHGQRCRTPLSWHFGYSGGSCGRQNAAGRRQCAIWERLAKKAGLRASCSSPVVRRVSPTGG